MRERSRRLLYLLATISFCLNCGSFKYSDPKPEFQFFGPESKLSVDVFDKLGYQVKTFGEGPASDWHKQQFQTVWTRGYQIKCRTSLREQANTFPRYDVVEEVYDSEALAAARLKRIREPPPDLLEGMEHYFMATGFQDQKIVYFIQTDASVFNYYMDDFAAELEKTIK